MNDLELYSTDDLIAELGKRFEHFVIAGRGKRIKSKGGYDFDSFEGNWIVCLGLCEKVKLTIAEDYKEKGPAEIKASEI